MSNILTNHGVYFDFNEPEMHPYDIEEIAHALSHICRFTGHVREFYSVAEHSVYVSRIVPKHLQMAALLHDASEAYLGDVASPLKALLPAYKAIERRVEEAIAKWFGQPYGLFPLAPEVKKADIKMLMRERGCLMPQTDDDSRQWPQIVPCKTKIMALPSPAARMMFLHRFSELRMQDKQWPVQ